MVLHIVGAGPTGVTIAWIMSGRGEEVHLWEKRDLPGGSWWTPSHTEDADRHAARVLFRSAQPNWTGLLRDMGLEYEKYYVLDREVISKSLAEMWESLELRDYLVLTGALVRAGVMKHVTVADALEGRVSASGQAFIRALTVSIDGVQWNRMTLWELADSINRTIFSGAWKERVQGRLLGEDLHRVLGEAGVHLHMDVGLESLKFPNLNFDNGETVSVGEEERVVLCLDPSAALPYISEYWEGVCVPDVIYGSRSFLLKYPKRFQIPSPHEALMASNNSFILSWVPGADTTTLHLADYNRGWESVEAATELLGLPEPVSWKECVETQDMSSAVWDIRGVPTQSPKHPQLHLVGMLSPRNTPYASVEAAAEVAMRWCGERPREPFAATTLIALILLIIFLSVVIRHAKAWNPFPSE